MLLLFNLLGLLLLAAGCGVWLGLVALGASMLVGVVAGSLTTVALDLALRRRARRGLLDHEGGGMLAFLPVWMVALFGLLAAVLVATALPDDWDRRPPRPPPDAAGARP